MAQPAAVAQRGPRRLPLVAGGLQEALVALAEVHHVITGLLGVGKWTKIQRNE